MDYQQQLQKVIDYIGQHLDESLTVEQLSTLACLSKFHFHRIFTAIIGVSLQQYIRWLRLKRAAHQLVLEKDKTIITIANDAGFSAHEAFSRAFKKACGLSPIAFRKAQDWSCWEVPPYSLSQQGEFEMNVTIREIDEIRLAAIEHCGDPNGLGVSINQLIDWVKAQPIADKPKAGDAFAIAYNDPHAVAPEEFRVDMCRKVPDSLILSEPVVEKRIPAGRYAVVMHKGSRNNMGGTIYPLYREWLPKSGEELGDFPCVFSYLNFDHEVADTELLTEIWVLLK